MIPRHSAMFVTIGAAAALALGVTTPAAAQLAPDAATVQRGDTTPAVSRQRSPVTEEQRTLDTTSAASASRQESPAVDSMGMYRAGPRMNRGRDGGGFYIGVGGGASVPLGDLHDGGYDTGWNVTVPIGWQAGNSPWGLRLDLSYDQLKGRTISSVPTSITLSDAKIWSGMLDLTLQFPFGNGGSGFYLMGGGGLHRFTDIGRDVVIGGITLSSGSSESLTKAGVNGGAGLTFGIGRVNLFLESRFVSVFTEGKNSNYVPIVLGLRFH